MGNIKTVSKELRKELQEMTDKDLCKLGKELYTDEIRWNSVAPRTYLSGISYLGSIAICRYRKGGPVKNQTAVKTFEELKNI